MKAQQLLAWDFFRWGQAMLDCTKLLIWTVLWKRYDMRHLWISSHYSHLQAHPYEALIRCSRCLCCYKWWRESQKLSTNGFAIFENTSIFGRYGFDLCWVYRTKYKKCVSRKLHCQKGSETRGVNFYKREISGHAVQSKSELVSWIGIPLLLLASWASCLHYKHTDGSDLSSTSEDAFALRIVFLSFLQSHKSSGIPM